MRVSVRKFSATIAAAALTLSLTACSGGEDAGTADTAATTAAADSTDADSAATDEGAWPRTITHELGETVLEQKPERIANTVLSATGTLLAMDAPLVASAATTVTDITDDRGFFIQWADEATDAGVEVLYDNLEFDLEALIAADPDVVIVSVSGNDSVADQYEQIAALFPTIAIDYSKQTWQELAGELGAALGLEEEAAAAIADFDAYVADAADQITVPAGGASLISYNGPGQSQGVAKPGGPHGELMAALDIEVPETDPAIDTSPQQRSDFAFVTYENLSQAVQGEAVFLVTGTGETVEEFTSEAVLANTPAVAEGRVYPLGPTSFRIDPYSGREVVDAVVTALG